MPAAYNVKEIQAQIKLHNNLKGWLKCSFAASSVAAILFWFSLKASLPLCIAAGILLVLAVLVLVIVGFAFNNSYHQIEKRIQSLKEGRA